MTQQRDEDREKEIGIGARIFQKLSAGEVYSPSHQSTAAPRPQSTLSRAANPIDWERPDHVRRPISSFR